MFEYENGFKKSMYWSKKKMLAHADKYSAAFSAKSLELLEAGKIPDSEKWKYSSFWYKDFDGMAMKTMLRQLISKWGIMSIDLQTAIDKDMAVIQEDGTADYVDHQQETVEEERNIVAEQEMKEVISPEQKETEKELASVESDFFN